MNIRIALIGPSGAGKTTFLARHSTGEFLHTPEKTESPTTTDLYWNTTKGKVEMKITEIPENCVISEGYDGYVVMVDSTKQGLYLKEAKDFVNFAKPRSQGSPVVVAFNKFDKVDSDKELMSRYAFVTLKERTGVRFYQTSGKSNYNYENPFLDLLRSKFGEDLQIKENPIN